MTPDRQTIAKLIDTSFIFRSLEGFVRARLLELAVPKNFAAGTVLMREDEAGTEMMIVVSGKVEVSQIGADGDVSLACPGPGAVLGEVAVITGTPRTSTVTAVEDTTVLSFSSEVIRDLVELHPRVGALLLKLIEGRAKQAVARHVESD